VKNSEFTDLFNYHLRKMEQSGLTHIILKRWRKRPTEVFSVPESITLGYNNTLFPFLLVTTGAIVAGIIALYEFAEEVISRV
jgi:hypothetical protein